VVIAGHEAHDGAKRLGKRGVDQVGQQLTKQQERAGPVAVVSFVAHLDHLSDDRLDVDRAVLAYGCPKRRAQNGVHPAQALDDVGGVGAVAQHLAQPLVERAEGRAAVRRVVQFEHPHR
jgi:hypothetical protein